MSFILSTMKYIISGTNRPGSNTLKISKLIQNLYSDQGEKVEILDLQNIPMHELKGLYSKEVPNPLLQEALDKVTNSEGLIFVVPEYNGSIPGILKYFVDHWKYPHSFEQRPVCFVGLGGMFGGLRPIEHLQQVMGYRNAFIFPIRIFLVNIWTTLKNDVLSDTLSLQLLKDQVVGFQKFCKALQSEGLDANSLNKRRGS